MTLLLPPVTLSDHHWKGTMSPTSGWSSSPQVTISHPWLALSLLSAVPLLEGVTRKSGVLLPPPPQGLFCKVNKPAFAGQEGTWVNSYTVHLLKLLFPRQFI